MIRLSTHGVRRGDPRRAPPDLEVSSAGRSGDAPRCAATGLGAGCPGSTPCMPSSPGSASQPAPLTLVRCGGAPAARLRLVDPPAVTPLHAHLDDALARPRQSLAALRGAEPVDARDGALALLRIHDLHVAPLAELTGRPNRQHHPVVADLKWRLEGAFLERLQEADARRPWDLPSDPVEALRAIQAMDRLPAVYRWLADEATPHQVRAFLEFEGGPDGGFDDLVAQCQVGVDGPAKVELARNYWEEMGGGDPARVHTELHRSMAASLGLRQRLRTELPVACLDRMLLGTTLATNRWLQPEMIGALGLIELQAGPRCRQVVTALRRIGAPPEALPFYEEHARVDPGHGRAWLDQVVGPLVDDHPDLGWRIVRGARWRSTVNAGFLVAVSSLLGAGGPRIGAGPVHVMDLGGRRPVPTRDPAG
jgi:hypothetical protein